MKTIKQKSILNSVAVIGNYLPRKCGIATFTTDLCNALLNELGHGCQISALAMDNVDSGYSYPNTVRFQLRDHWLPDYLNAAEFLNVNQFDIAILQHEFGIFGGKDGSHILRLIKNLNMPLITTLHTVLDAPSDEQRKIILNIAEYSDKLVVMSEKARDMLQAVYKINASQISIIHHGIPDVSFVDPCFYKDTFGIEDRQVILTFGLLHPGKGIEFVLNALPKIIKKHPNIIYVVLGATHPNILRETGDAYRQSLLQLVNRLDLKNHVQFKNQFVELEELCEYIGATDIFITPYLAAEQIASGTLAYTIGAGKAVISTPYWYATEMLSEGRGRLVPFKDSDKIALEVNDLLSNEHERNAMRKKAYQFGRLMIWKEVARNYVAEAIDVLDMRASKPKARYVETHIPKSIDELPPPDLKHLRAMTDSTGILQHSHYVIPNREHGYCTDDNARALVVTSLHHSIHKDENSITLTETYLAFLSHAFNHKNNRFRNFMSYDRKWLEEEGSEDSHGRALWGLGFAVKHAPYESIRNMATRLFVDGLTAVKKLRSPRALAYCLVGLHSYLDVYSGDATARRIRNATAKKLHGMFENISNPEWPWCEDVVTYANAKIPHALLLAGQRIPDAKMRKKGLSLLKWLLKVQTAPKGHLSIIGNRGWFKYGKKPSPFDQQPIEAMSLLDACAEAYYSTKDETWLNEARRCLNWFLGYNDLHIPLYDFKTGGCSDGLNPQGVNANEGAESTLAWLISVLTMFEIMGQQVILKKRAERGKTATKKIIRKG